MSIDIRAIALETPLRQQPLWIEIWGTWVTVRELTAEERGDLLEKCTTVEKNARTGKREAKINQKLLYPMMVVQSLRNPDPNNLPDKSDPNYAKYPGATDEQGNYLTPPHDKAGELIFSPTDIPWLKKRSGGVLELATKPASIMSGLRDEDLEEKKEPSEDSGSQETPTNTVESTGYTIG